MIEMILMGLYKALAIGVVFGLAVFVHEFGHMLFALIRGVGVESFAIGMGPKITSWTWGGIDFSLRWLPVGGFVKLAGPMPGEEAEADEGPQTRAFAPAEQTNSIELGRDREREEAAEGDDKSLQESSYDDLMALADKGLLTKILVFGGGVFMNFCTAIVAMFFLMILPKNVPDLPPVVWGVPEGSALAQAGLRQGDRIETINGLKIERTYDVDKSIDDLVEDAGLANASKDELSSFPLKLTVARAEAGTTRTVALAPVSVGHFYDAFSEMDWRRPPLIGQVNVGLPAEKAGLKAGDWIVSVDGHKIDYFNELLPLLKDRAEKKTTITVRRDGELTSVSLTPVLNPETFDRGMIGIGSGSERTISVPGVSVGRAFIHAPGETIGMLVGLVKANINFFKRASLKQVGENLGGPVLIARMTASAASQGINELLSFFIMLNLLLMVFNLLPLPVLDGGFILVSIIEAVIRRPVPPRVLGPIYTVFVVFFISLMLIITLMDVKHWIM